MCNYTRARYPCRGKLEVTLTHKCNKAPPQDAADSTHKKSVQLAFPNAWCEECTIRFDGSVAALGTGQVLREGPKTTGVDALSGKAGRGRKRERVEEREEMERLKGDGGAAARRKLV